MVFEDRVIIGLQIIWQKDLKERNIEVNCLPISLFTMVYPRAQFWGPLLFVLYINDLPQCLSKSQIRMYADDTVIYFSGTKSCNIEVILQSDINKVEQWLLENRLVLNLSKTKVLLFGAIQKLGNVSSFNVKFQDQAIERVSKFIYLGITLDENLNWKEHVDAVCIKANKCLSLLARIRPCLNLKASKCGYNCLILSTLTYADAAWGELSAMCDENLQRLQNRAARIIARRYRSNEAMTMLGWPLLKTIRKRNKCILVFKCLHDLVPKYLSEYFIRNSNVHSYNIRRCNDIHPPKPKLSLGKRTFRYSGTLLFNSLPLRIKASTSLTSFKNFIRQYNF